MPPKDIEKDRNRIRHMLKAIAEIKKFTKDKSLQDFRKDRQLLLATVKDIEIIGEAASKISKAFQDKYGQIPWKEIISTRNRLIHGYFEINEKIVWQTIEQDLIPLERQLKNIT